MTTATLHWQDITDDRKKYAAYLCSREWAEKREAVRERARNKCERCETLPMDACHHLTYERKYNEALEDLQAICNPCHEFTHGKDNFDPKINDEFIRWLSFFDANNLGWLTAEWKTDFLRDVFEFPYFMPVFQMWLSFEFAARGSLETVESFCDYKDSEGSSVGDVGWIPTMEERLYIDDLRPTLRSFWSWLKWGGPTQYPIGDKAAFLRCLELADSIRKKD